MPGTSGRGGAEMSKPSAERRLDDTAASAFLRALRISARKLNLVAQTIRGKDAAAALAELTFSRRRIAQDVRKVLQAAIANAENNHQLDVDRLYVKEATVGRAFVMSVSTRAAAAARRASKSISRISALSCASAPKTKLERVPDGTESQSDRAAARHQPHLGFALVLAQGIRQPAARRSEIAQIPRRPVDPGGDLKGVDRARREKDPHHLAFGAPWRRHRQEGR